jgi:hypothetical protein
MDGQKFYNFNLKNLGFHFERLIYLRKNFKKLYRTFNRALCALAKLINKNQTGNNIT